MPKVDPAVFMASFLKAAKENKISLVVVYGYESAGRGVLRLSSTVPEKETKDLLAWMFKHGVPTQEPDPFADATVTKAS